jgi:hypothetical protein
MRHNGIDKRVIIQMNGTEAGKDRKCEEPLEYFVHHAIVELQCDQMGRGLELYRGGFIRLLNNYFDEQSLEARKAADDFKESRHVLE